MLLLLLLFLWLLHRVEGEACEKEGRGEARKGLWRSQVGV